MCLAKHFNLQSVTCEDVYQCPVTFQGLEAMEDQQTHVFSNFVIQLFSVLGQGQPAFLGFDPKTRSYLEHCLFTLRILQYHQDGY